MGLWAGWDACPSSLAGEGTNAPGGVRVNEGGQLEAEVQGTRERARVPVQVLTLCAALTNAAPNPGREYRDDRPRFKGHQPWVESLLCEYVEKGRGATPVFEDYRERRAFLDAFEHRQLLAGQ